LVNFKPNIHFKLIIKIKLKDLKRSTSWSAVCDALQMASAGTGDVAPRTAESAAKSHVQARYSDSTSLSVIQ